jgi:hypothetical protein
MNPLDFLNEAIRKIIGGPTPEDDLRVKYVETLVNPAGFIDEARGVVESINQRNEKLREILDDNSIRR